MSWEVRSNVCSPKYVLYTDLSLAWWYPKLGTIVVGNPWNVRGLADCEIFSLFTTFTIHIFHIYEHTRTFRKTKLIRNLKCLTVISLQMLSWHFLLSLLFHSFPLTPYHLLELHDSIRSCRWTEWVRLKRGDAHMAILNI